MRHLTIPAPAAPRHRLLRPRVTQPPQPRANAVNPPATLSLGRGLAGAVVLHLLAGWLLSQFTWQTRTDSVPVISVPLPPVELLAPEPEAHVAGPDTGPALPTPFYAAPALPVTLPPALPGIASAVTMPVTEVITVEHILAASAPALWFRPPATGHDEPVATESVAGTASGTGPGTNVVAVQAGYFRNPPPVYPPAAKAQGWEGTTVLRVCVSTTGASSVVEVRQSSGYPVLDEAAVRAVRRWRFVPARENKVAVTAWVEVPIVFELNREPFAS